MTISVLEAKHQAARRKFRTRATLIITAYAAAVGALAGFITAGIILQPGDALPWVGVSALAAAALVSVSLRFTFAPADPATLEGIDQP